MKMAFATSGLVAGLFALACHSHGTPDDCSTAGGQCVINQVGHTCTKLGPANTCNCNPDCDPAGSYCCLDLVSNDAAP